MNWLSWTATKGWRVLKNAVTGENQRVEMARLVEGLNEIHQVDSGRHPIIEAPDDRKCACCRGSRCTAWRQSGHITGCGGHGEDDKCWHSDEEGVRVDGCGGEAEPLPMGASFLHLMNEAIVTPGRHTLRYVIEHAVPWTWNPIPLRTRVMLWPMHYARKLGRPVQIGPRTRMAFP